MLVFLAVLAMVQHISAQSHIQSPFKDNDVFRLKSIVLKDNTNIPIQTPYTTVFQPTSNCECDMSISVANNMHSHLKIENMVSTKLTREVTTYDMTTRTDTTAMQSYDMSVLDVTMQPVITTTMMADPESIDVEMAIAQILPTVDKILLEELPGMPMTAVFEGMEGGVVVFERASQ
jgi:hypothetical protein